MSKKAKVTSTTSTKGEELPMLCLFSSAPPEARVIDSMTMSLAKKPSTSLRVDTDEATYVSVEEKNTNYAIGTYDPKTKTMKFSPVGNVFKLVLEAKEATYAPDEETKTSSQMMRSEVALAGAFGSTRRQKMFEDRDAYKLGTTDITQLPDISAEHKENTKDIKQAKQSTYIEQMRQVLPKFDLTAKEPKDIFSIDSIVPSSVLDSIDASEIVDAIKKQSKRTEAASKYPSFVMSFLTSKDTLKRKNFCQYALYVSLMIHAYKHFYVARKKSVRCPETGIAIAAAHNITISEDLASALISTFTSREGKRYQLNAQSEDKLLFHIMVMALYMHNYQKFEISELASSLQMDKQKLANYFKVIGCSVGSGSGHAGEKRKRSDNETADEEEPAGDANDEEATANAEEASTSTNKESRSAASATKQYFVELRAPLCLREFVRSRPFKR